MTAVDLEQLAEFTRDLAQAAGQIIFDERESNDVALDYKNHQELVTSADLKADKYIRQQIEQHFPQHKILSEESSSEWLEEMAEGPLWIIDPIDGTVNFAHEHYQVAVSIAFAIDGQVMAAAVYNPFLDEMFTAVKGRGAFCDDLPIRTSSTNNLRQSIVATGFPYKKDEIKTIIATLEKVLTQCGDIRRLGSAALDICWVASGKLDAYYESVSPWDSAAACLIAKEAGATVGHFSEVPSDIPVDIYSKNLIVSTPSIHEELLTILKTP